MTRLTIYTIITARFILIILGYIIALPVWIIRVLSLCVEIVSAAYLSSLLSFVSSTKELNTRFEQQLKETSK